MSKQGRVAIVTGGSAGIGLAVVERMVKEGITVVMVARTASTLEQEAARLGSRVVPRVLDVSDLEALAALPGEVVAQLGRLDIVVNNAGAHARGPVDRIPAPALAQMIHVNLTAPIVLSRAALPFLGQDGTIVNITSLAGRTPLPEAATYSATKVGLRYFSTALAEERPDLRVCCVSPGPVDTGFFGDIERVSDLVFSQPMSTADEVAADVMACLSGPSRELAIPRLSGWLTAFVNLFPSVRRALRPLLKRKGARAKAAYIAEKKRQAAAAG